MFKHLMGSAYHLHGGGIAFDGDKGGSGGTGAQSADSGAQEESTPFRDPYLELAGIKDLEEEDGDEGAEAILAAFADEEEKEEDEHPAVLPNGQKSPAEENQAAAAQLADQIRTSISAAKLPDELFGDDFDPSNPTSVRETMEKVYRLGIQNSVATAMKPMQMAMAQLRTLLHSEMETRIADAQGKFATKSRLDALVPALSNPKARKVLEPMRDILAGQKKSVEEQAKALNQIAARLGFDKTSKSGGTKPAGDGTKGVSRRSGSSALDSLFSS